MSGYGWFVSVARVRDDGTTSFNMYAVAIHDADQAISLALVAAGAEAAVVNGPLDEATAQALGLKPGQLAKVHDETTHPLLTGTTVH